MNERFLKLLKEVGILFLAIVCTACSHNGENRNSDFPFAPRLNSGEGVAKVAPEEGENNLRNIAKAQREKWKDRTFEEFEGSVYKEPFTGGKYIVSGDIPISNKKLLREFFDNQIKKDLPVASAQSTGFVGKQGKQMILHMIMAGENSQWNSKKKKSLTYCVSDSFGLRKNKVVADLLAAANAWEAAADINFTHLADYDADCTPSNVNVLFDVRPVKSNSQFLARAFFPNEPRSARNVLIDESSMELNPGNKLQLVGILRHELGHTLGVRHEHTRPESGTCFEDAGWRPITTYDRFSVMHYPHCNGGGNREFQLTEKDQNGLACVYGPAKGFQINTSICQPEVVPPSPICDCSKNVEFTQQQVQQGQQNTYGPPDNPSGPFPVTPGTPFEVTMKGNGNPGDPDLYVRFNQAPSVSQFTCRPYTSGADETCSLDVPTGSTQAHVMVWGYQSGGYDLSVTYTP